MIPPGLRRFLFSARGRASRAQFWGFTLLVSLPVNVAGNLLGVLSAHAPGGVLALPLYLLDAAWLLLALILVWPSFAVPIRRLHDRDRSGWFLLIIFVPIYGVIRLIYELGFAR